MRRKAKEERLFQSVRAVLTEKETLLVKGKSLMKGLNSYSLFPGDLPWQRHQYS